MAKITKDKRIKKEVDRLKKVFVDIDKGKLSSLEGLIYRAAYMRVTLEDYEADLDKGGYVELFTQSEKTPPYERERPVARLYNSMNRNYQTLIKQLIEALPESDSISDDLEVREFMEFIKG